MIDFMEILPGRQRLKRVYLTLILWFFGRAIQAAARVDHGVKSEFAAMPGHYTFCLGAFPNGPFMVVGKDAQGRVRYLGSSTANRTIHLHLMFKSINLLFVTLTLQESTSTANARDRLFVSGDVPQACAVVRVMDLIQVLLLPKFLAKLAVKRYPDWSLKRRTLVRAMVYIRAVAGH
ncbi:MAG: hypothetical protein K9K40_10240 [Desulfotignum sp.]|nr:hypothetical protein [Desulfotignum sp.]